MTASESPDTIDAHSLSRLRHDTGRALTLFNSKDNWPNAYPFIARLSESFSIHYAVAPRAMQAQLSFYHAPAHYSANYTINAAILVCALSYRLEYTQQDCYTMTSAVLATLLAVKQEQELLNQGEALSATQTKRWQHRYHLALKILTSQGTKLPTMTGILAKLDKYKTALLNGRQIMLYDGMTRVVALALILAGRITPSKARKACSLRQAIADMYVRTPDYHTQRLLKLLQQEVGGCLAGTQVMLNQQCYTYIGPGKETRALLAHQQKGKIRLCQSTQRIEAASQQVQVASLRMPAQLWFQCAESLAPFERKTSATETEPLFSSLARSEQSYSQLVKLLAPYPSLSNEVLSSANAYNREGQKAANLRHALSMVGSYNAPVFVIRVILQHQLMSLSHPLEDFIKGRVKGALNICRLMLSRRQDIHFEHFTACVMAYFLFICRETSSSVSRALQQPDNSESTVLPLSLLLGTSVKDISELSQFIDSHVGANSWTNALLESETVTKSDIKSHARYFVALKLLCLCAYLPGYTLSAWQKQLLDGCAKELGWHSGKHLLSYLPEVGLYNGV